MLNLLNPLNSAPQGVGLVLSGGGAKGAYQAGVVRCLAEHGIPIGAVSGASIGSLNGAIVASAPSLVIAAQHLENIWLTLGRENPIKKNNLGIVAQLGVLLLNFSLMYAGDHAKTILLKSGAAQLVTNQLNVNLALFDDKPIVALLSKYIQFDKICSGLPFWVSACPSEGFLQDAAGIIKEMSGLGKNQQADFFHIQSLQSAEEMLQILMASTAIPLAFPAQNTQGKRYIDGGVGGFTKNQGNTPITPLVKAGYSHVIVTHLADGSFWNRYDFPHTTILEIRPLGIAREGLGDLLNFNQATIEEWIEQGYQDTSRQIGAIVDALATLRHLRQAEKQADASLKNLLKDDFHIE